MNKLTVSSSPHIHTKDTTNRIMLDVIIALLPAAIAGVVIFGWRALLVVLTTVAASVLSELVFNIIVKKEQTISDLSAVVTGLLLALNLPATAPIWQCVIGAVFAIVVVKCLFGGLGCNFANPAITARIFLMISFTSTIGVGALPVAQNGGELITGATPLAAMKDMSVEGLPSLLDMFFGVRGGAIGESCILALLLGFAYLVVRRVIHFETPLIFISTVFVLTMIITNDPLLSLYHLMAGGLVLGAVFMATDYVTTPITRTGKMIFAAGCGLITVLIRMYGSYPEGVSFSILLMNILSPYIEKWTAPKALGGKK